MQDKTAVSRSARQGAAPTRERILAAASRLFTVKGFAGTSTREIAEAVGITQPGLYRHFASKNDILATLARDVLEPEVRIAERERRTPGSPAIRLARLLRDISEDLAASPYRVGFLLTEPAVMEPAFTEPDLEFVKPQYRRVTRAVETILREGIEAGDFRALSPRLTQATIMSLTDIVIFPSKGSTQERVRHLVDFALRAVLADPQRAEHVWTALATERSQSDT